MSFELKRKEITVCDETLVVHQASNLMDTKRSLMISEANERWKGQDLDGMEAQARRYLETLLYPSLTSCTTGNVPTVEEFLNGVPVDDTENWVAAAKELNPRWFPDQTDHAPDEESAETEKKESSPTSSLPG